MKPPAYANGHAAPPVEAAPGYRLSNWGIPLGIAAAYCLPAAQPDMRLAIPMIVGATAVVTMLLAVTLYLGEKGAVRWTPRTILLVAAGLRLLFLFRPPELSDDIYRYLWDGLQVLAGHNPYSSAPADFKPHSYALAGLLGRVNHSDMITIYPPAAQLIFAAGASLGGTVIGLKAFLVVLDLLTCHLIIRLLAVLGMPAWRAVLYAWHPLSVLEIAASGHIDGAAISLFFVAFSLVAAQTVERPSGTSREGLSGFSPRRVIIPLASGLAFAGSVLVKLFPVLFLPGCFGLLPRRGRIYFCVGLLAGGIALAVPFMADLHKAVSTLRCYAQNWEFSGFVFQGLKNAGLSGNRARGVIAMLFLISLIFLYRALWSERALRERRSSTGECRRSSGSEVPEALDVREALDVPRSGASPYPLLPALHTFHSISMALLLLSPTLYPWYALVLAGLLPFAAGPAGLILSWSVFLSYRVVIPYTLLGLWIEDGSTAALVWLAPAGAFCLSALARGLMRSQRYRWPA